MQSSCLTASACVCELRVTDYKNHIGSTLINSWSATADTAVTPAALKPSFSNVAVTLQPSIAKIPGRETQMFRSTQPHAPASKIPMFV